MGPYIKSGRKWVELAVRVFDVLIYDIPPLFLFSARSFRNEPPFLEHTVFSLSPEQGCYCIKKRKLEKRAKFPGGGGGYYPNTGWWCVAEKKQPNPNFSDQNVIFGSL